MSKTGQTEENNNEIIETEVTVAVAGSIDSGKCFGKGTKIMMYDNTIKDVENIEIGDIVMGDDFTQRIVLETHTGFGQLYEIKTSNHQKYIVNGHHILCLKDEYNNIIEISVNDYLNHDKELYWYKTKTNNHKINTKINLYNVGYNLGIEILNNKSCIILYDIYKNNSIDNRIDFIAGIIDSIGYYDNNTNTYVINIIDKYRGIFNDIYTIIYSLGLDTYHNESSKIQFKSHLNLPVKLEKNKGKIIDTPSLKYSFKISKIENNYYYGFSVTGNKRFLLNDFSVVHNSSLIGVLHSGELDDGNGYTRNFVAKHRHEIESGKTSDISSKVMYCGNKKAITMIDLCGHEKYLKTTTRGITGLYPDYAIVVIAANRGILQMTKEHLGLLFYIEIPIIIVITRSDIAPLGIYKNTIKGIKSLCRRYNKTPNFINNINSRDYDNMDELDRISKILYNTCDHIPIITISNKTGYYINTLKQLLGKLKPRKIWETNKEDNIFYIESTYNPPGLGVIVAGILKGRDIKVGDSLYIGPINNEFIQIRIRSIHNNYRQLIPKLKDYERGCLAIAPVSGKTTLTKNMITRGTIITSNLNLANNVCYKFKAQVEVLHHSATIADGYCSVIHIGNIKQTARIVNIQKLIHQQNIYDHNDEDKLTLKTNDKAIVVFEFVYKPEFIEIDSIFFFREGTTRGVGKIIDIYPVK